MKPLRAVVAVLLDLVIGDDWRIAAGIVVTLAGTAALAHQGVPVWWLPPLAVLALLTGTVVVARKRARMQAEPPAAAS